MYKKGWSKGSRGTLRYFAVKMNRLFCIFLAQKEPRWLGCSDCSFCFFFSSYPAYRAGRHIFQLRPAGGAATSLPNSDNNKFPSGISLPYFVFFSISLALSCFFPSFSLVSSGLVRLFKNKLGPSLPCNYQRLLAAAPV